MNDFFKLVKADWASGLIWKTFLIAGSAVALAVVVLRRIFHTH